MSLFPLVNAAESIPLVEVLKNKIINPIISFLFALALVYFLWGVLEMVQNGDNDSAREKGRQHVLWGVIGMFIMVSVYGLLRVVCSTLDVTC